MENLKNSLSPSTSKGLFPIVETVSYIRGFLLIGAMSESLLEASGPHCPGLSEGFE